MRIVNYQYQIKDLPDRHQLGLKWFVYHEKRTKQFPDLLDSGQFLATKTKGIYVPIDSQYALSIRATTSSPHKDGELFRFHEDGWVFSFHEEIDAENFQNSNQLLTNRGLQFCLEDKVPVGILKQRSSDSNEGSSYDVIGLGAVIAKIGSYFIITDINSATTTDTTVLIDYLLRQEAERRVTNPSQQEAESNEGLGALDEYQAKVKVWAQIVRRQGQGQFRNQLLRAYDGKCCITETAEETVLDAAHIRAYNGPSTNDVTNGLLLRTDLHALFDLNKLGIEPETYLVHIHKSITDPYYRSLERTQIRIPILESDLPSFSSLLQKWENFEFTARA